MNKQVTAARANVKPAIKTSTKAAEVEIAESALTPEEEAALDGGHDPSEVPAAEEDVTDKAPDWGIVPPNLKLPPSGVVMAFLRIPSKLTMNPSKGDRQCIVWPLDEVEETRAHKRARGERPLAVQELAKGCVRAVDGAAVEWGMGAANLMTFWKEIGPKGRALVINYYMKQHVVDEEEALDFFSNHFAAVTVQRS